jgi:hypothetical protein
MNANNAEQRLVEAEAKLTRALQRLSALRRAALYGNYDPAEFDRAVMAYREAEMEAQDARRALATRSDDALVPLDALRAAQRAEVAQPAPDDDQPYVLEITPRLRFAKWLVDNGRLTDDLPEEAYLRAA